MEPISSLSREWIYIWVYGAAGTEQVEVAFTTPGVEPAPADWKTAEWSPGSATGKGTDARILFGPGGTVTLPDGTYQAWVRVTGEIVQPVLPSGLISVI